MRCFCRESQKQRTILSLGVQEKDNRPFVSSGL
jgi:hypothetical protein